MSTNIKVALISPRIVCDKNQVRRTQPPLGIGYLAAVLETNGFCNLLIIDASVEDYNQVTSLPADPDLLTYGLADDRMIVRLKDFQPKVIGLSILFSSQISCGLELAKKIKENLPQTIVVLGGNHATTCASDILRQEPAIDFIIRGEGEYSFLNFIEQISNNSCEWQKIPGLVWRDDLEIKANPEVTFIKNLDHLPFPTWHRMNMEEYFRIAMPHNPFVKSGRVGCIMTSRGCPQQCYFCSSSDYFGHRFRALSSQRVIEMVQYLVDNFHIEELQIIDDNFTVDYRRVLEICQGLKNFKLRITFPNATRADRPVENQNRLEMFKALREAGCEQIGFSVEHGDQDFLNNVIGKYLDLREVIISVELAHQAGLLVHCNFMTGFPLETASQRQRTAEFSRALLADSFSLSLATPLPGTKMWAIAEKNNLFLENFNNNRILYGQVSIKPIDISVEELQRFAEDLNRELNEKAKTRNPLAAQKYELIQGKQINNDRKY